jgi:hypothetical protein
MSTDFEGNDFKKYKNNCSIFIETGSELGNGIQTALKAGFETVYSIELDEKFHNHCKERFKDDNRVNLILGDSMVELPKLINDIKELNFLLWLDAHWSAEGYAGEMMHDFLPKEMQALIPLNHKLKEAVVMIDDMNHYINNKAFCSGIEYILKQLKPNSDIEYYKSSNENIFLISV